MFPVEISAAVRMHPSGPPPCPFRAYTWGGVPGCQFSAGCLSSKLTVLSVVWGCPLLLPLPSGDFLAFASLVHFFHCQWSRVFSLCGSVFCVALAPVPGTLCCVASGAWRPSLTEAHRWAGTLFSLLGETEVKAVALRAASRLLTLLVPLRWPWQAAWPLSHPFPSCNGVTRMKQARASWPSHRAWHLSGCPPSASGTSVGVPFLPSLPPVGAMCCPATLGPRGAGVPLAGAAAAGDPFLLVLACCRLWGQGPGSAVPASLGAWAFFLLKSAPDCIVSLHIRVLRATPNPSVTGDGPSWR